MEEKRDSSGVIQVVSMILRRLKDYYKQQVVERYNIETKLLES